MIFEAELMHAAGNVAFKRIVFCRFPISAFMDVVPIISALPESHDISLPLSLSLSLVSLSPLSLSLLSPLPCLSLSLSLPPLSLSLSLSSLFLCVCVSVCVCGCVCCVCVCERVWELCVVCVCVVCACVCACVRGCVCVLSVCVREWVRVSVRVCVWVWERVRGCGVCAVIYIYMNRVEHLMQPDVFCVNTKLFFKCHYKAFTVPAGKPSSYVNHHETLLHPLKIKTAPNTTRKNDPERLMMNEWRSNAANQW